MLKSVQTILHPPELKDKDRRRYWLAVVGWFVCLMFTLLVFFTILYALMVAVERYLPEITKTKEFVGALLIVVGVSGIILSDRLWSRLFIHSGYLSDAAAIRILSNRAPTHKSERRHRWLGHALMLVIYGGMGIWAVLGRQWWMLVIVVPLGIWGVFLIRNAWKEADRMLAGGPIPSASEERIDYIEQVLDKRRQRNDHDRDPSK